MNFVAEFQKTIKGRSIPQAPMAQYTTLGVGGSAELLFYPADLPDLFRALSLCRDRRIPFFPKGRGSNLLVRDGGVEGVIIDLSEGFNQISLEGEQKVRAQSGVGLNTLLRFCRRHLLGGLEFLVGIPASVGGAIKMNAGGREREIKDAVGEITILDTTKITQTPGRNPPPQGCEGLTAEALAKAGLSAEALAKAGVQTLTREQLRFTYRHLHLPPDTIILEAKLNLEPTDLANTRFLTERFLTRRRRTQPLGLPNAGSIFRNPPGDYAGRLIEKVGLKGFRVGGAKISDKHANIIVNTGEATARDVLELMEIATQKVYASEGIKLKPEIEIIGKD